jgi:hypothetical protein
MRKTVAIDRGNQEEKSYNLFVHAVFLAVVLGAGSVIWGLVKENAALDKRVTVLENKCIPATTRGSSSHT